MGVSLVSTVPLPANPVKTENVLANDSKGLTQSQPKPVEKEPDAIPIPDKATKVKPVPTPKTATHQKPQPAPEIEADNVVPYRPGRASQRTLWHLQRQRRQGWLRLYRRRRRFRIALCLVCARGAAEGFGKLAEV